MVKIEASIKDHSLSKYQGNKFGELKFTQCSIKVSFQGRGIFKNVKIQTKLLHLGHEVFCKLHIHLVTKLYTLLLLDTA